VSRPRPPGRLLDRFSTWVLGQLDWWRGICVAPLLLAYRLSDQKELIEDDVGRWAEILWPGNEPDALAQLLYAFPGFRAVFYHRLHHGNPTGALLGRLCAPIWRIVPGLELDGTRLIGPGLFISHGQGTVLSAERIGANLWVHHQVTIGWDYHSDRRPIIGDGVFIGAGAKIMGAITVGDGARIGANAVVVCDVPPGATAIGIPARIQTGP
jgi:serine O-acetyltransferase